MHPVGRLDYDTTGLLLFSSSGPLTQTLLHPKHSIEKEYVATVAGCVDTSSLEQKLATGLEIAGLEGIHTARLLSVDHMERSAVRPYLDTIRANLPYNTTDLHNRGYLEPLESSELSIVHLVVTEGKHRIVRRLLHNCGHSVVSLHRQRLGEISLGEETPEGEWRDLTANERQWADSLLSNKPKRREKSP